MIAQVPFSLQAWHDIVLQPQQTRNHLDFMAVDGPIWTFVDDGGHCLACGGLYPAMDGIAVAWAYIGADCGPVMPALFKRARAALLEGLTHWPVIRSGALADFAAGNRLLELLGFTPIGVKVTHEARVYNVFEWRVRRPPGVTPS